MQLFFMHTGLICVQDLCYLLCSYLRDNQLTRGIPKELGNLSKLERL